MTFQKCFDSAAGKKHFWRQNSNRRKIEIQILRKKEVLRKFVIEEWLAVSMAAAKPRPILQNSLGKVS